MLRIDEAMNQADAEFARACASLEDWLCLFNAEDACLSLSVSDLWLPNISSQVKHTLVYCVLASISPDRFAATHRIENYLQFRDFITQLHVRLPQFPSLEDYVPEGDWGEIRIESGQSVLRCFYGGNLERLSDFVTGFLMLHRDNALARRDLHAILSIQDYVIARVDRDLIGSATEIDTGHLEVPAEPFWATCREALIGVSSLPQTQAFDLGMVASLGAFTAPRSRNDFGEGVFSGSALPMVLLDISGCRLPVSIRNGPAAVIQYWVDRGKDPRALALVASSSISEFLRERFDSRHLFPGPLRLMNRTERLPYTFAAAMMGHSQLYLVIALPEEEMPQLPAIEEAVKALVTRGDWGMWSHGAAHGVQLRRNDGTQPTAADVVLIAVLARITTAPGILNLPKKTSARVLPLVDFVTIFDAIEDLDELDRFWRFTRDNIAVQGPIGLVDHFGAFRDSHALLADGAVTPNFIALDPLWGSKWRYRQLEEFWANAPPLFPDDCGASWKVTRDNDGLFRLIGRPAPILSWSAVVGNSIIHFAFDMREQDLAIDDGRILELLVHCLGDSLAQRGGIVAGLPLFQHRRIVTTCRAHPEMLTSHDEAGASLDHRPLLSNWSASATPKGDVRARVDVNLHRAYQRLTEPTDARFEVEAVLAWIDGLSQTLGISAVPEESRAAMLATATRKPRFTVRTLARRVDVPQFADPAVPGPEHFKLARRDLAIVFKALGAQEGKYELAAAKAFIDPARDKFRALVHERIAALRRDDLVTFCIEQLDALMGKYDVESTRIKLSLNHEVSYDRSESLAQAHETFVKDSRNYRYLLECCLSAPTSGSGEVTERVIVELVASIDWLQVLYGASDVLHNGIDVAGLELDHFYIPHVFYSEGWSEREAAFAAENADLKLGVGVTATDEVPEATSDSVEWHRVNAMFAEEVGVRLGQFLGGLMVLSCWPSANEESDLCWSYSSTREQLRNILVKSVEELDAVQADTIISLATLDPKGVRRLLGKPVDESDVPIWEHNKRSNRYTIKPLVAQGDGAFRWGAAAAERAARIWRASIANGYLPADFDWPKVGEAVRAIKAQLEEQLEITAHAIVQRGTPFSLRGIDFMRRFPKLHFDDVGDYDVLAFWPATNHWVVVECKYNQPAFCLKDARRLRERIFGTGDDRAQFAKIERRRAFLAKNSQKLRSLLAWPAPPAGVAERFSEVYASRDIYWWMRNPPYPVPTEFVRVDVLAHWLRTGGLLE